MRQFTFGLVAATATLSGSVLTAHCQVNQNSQKVVTVLAKDAQIQGRTATLENGDSNIGSWSDAQDSVRWMLPAGTMGTVRVRMLYSLAPSSAGSTLKVTVGNQTRTFTPPATLSWVDYQTLDLGEFRVGDAGPQTVTLQVEQKRSQFIVNVHSLSFQTGGARTPGSKPMPVVSAVKQEADGATLRMNSGVMRLQVCADGIVRVRCSPTSLPAPENYVVNRKWSPAPFKMRQSRDEVTLSTAKLQVVVNKGTGAIDFRDRSGKLLLREVQGGGKVFSPAIDNGEATYSVQQSFQSPPDEALYGMGQFPQGTWNWRGMPLELRQHNTQIGVPMLLSSKGYGLLWDNASVTEFNPTDTLVALSGPGVRSGTFTPTTAGTYVFQARNGNQRGKLAILVDGKLIGGITNTWSPHSLSARTVLEANKTYTVAVDGGGDNTQLSVQPLGNTTTFRSQVGRAIDYTFFYGPEMDYVVRGYRLATGAAPMWPKWAYGFWQCRERYSSQRQIVDAVAEFRRRQIPIDLLVQDWQYWGPHGWGAYQWDAAAYPDPKSMIETLHEQNVKFMISVWHDPQGTAREDLSKVNGFMKSKDGRPSEWIDVFNPTARAVRWDAINKAFFSIGTDSWWNDATEPGDSVGGITDQQTAMGSANALNNAYALQGAQGVYEGQRATNPQKRVVNLTRSAYAGMQRYGAGIWSGDISGDWETLGNQIPAGLNFCMTGIPYWTTDSGGFFRPGNQHTSPDFNELQTRWFQWSTFSPMLRIHGYQSETEMWKWLPETQKNLLAYDQLRYRLLPYNYSVAWKVTSDGYTIMRALPMDFRSDPKASSISGQYMFGPSFLVAPVTKPNRTEWPVYLPSGTQWTNFWTGATFKGGATVNTPAPLDTIPLYVRAGSIVPMGPQLQWATEKPADPIELRVYRGADGSFELYEDEGDNYNYEKGAYSVIPIKWNENAKTLSIGARRGQFPSMLAKRTFHIVWVGSNHGVGNQSDVKADAVVTYTGRPINIKGS